jgi:flagellar basal-body rod modification protein FlgD
VTDISALTASAAAAPPPARATSVANGLGADTFLQLLVAQLKYQDPTNPADSTEFLAQTAQFTMVEKLTELAERAQASAAVEQNLAAAGMVGRTVSYQRLDGTAGQGVVTKAALGTAGPVLHVGTDEVALDRVTAVVHQPAPTAPATSPTTHTTPTAPADPQD